MWFEFLPESNSKRVVRNRCYSTSTRNFCLICCMVMIRILVFEYLTHVRPNHYRLVRVESEVHLKLACHFPPNQDVVPQRHLIQPELLKACWHKVPYESSLLWSFMQGRCNTLQHPATHCNIPWLQHTARRHTFTWESSHLCFFILSLVRTCNAFSSASSFICVTWLIHSEEKHSPTHMCDMKTSTHSSYVGHQLCYIRSTHSFICAIWHPFIHMCDITHSQREEKLIRVTWRPKIFSGASFFVLYYTQNKTKTQKKTLHTYECVIVQILMNHLTCINEACHIHD